MDTVVEVTKTIHELQSAFAEFRETNDKRIAELEKKASVDPLITEKLERIEKDTQALEQRIEKYLARLSQPFDPYSDGEDDKEIRKDFSEFVKERKLRSIAPGEEFGVEDFKEYKKAFEKYLRKGEQSLPTEFVKALFSAHDPDGGFLLTPRLRRMIQTHVYESSPIRQLANVVTISTDGLEFVVDNDEAAAGWVGEQGSRPETATPQFGVITITADEMYAMPGVTQRFLDDAGIDVEAFLSQKIADKFARLEASAFLVGDGIQRPRGILSYPAGTSAGQIQRISTGSANSLSLDDLYSAEAELKEPYRTDAVWLMHRKVVGYVRKLKDSNGQYLWQPSVQAGQPSTLLGYPVRTAADLDDSVTSNNEVVIFGSIRRAYTIVDRVGMRVIRDVFTAKGKVLFYTTRRVGGAVTNFEALKIIKVS